MKNEDVISASYRGFSEGLSEKMYEKHLMCLVQHILFSVMLALVAILVTLRTSPRTNTSSEDRLDVFISLTSLTSGGLFLFASGCLI